MSHRRHRRHRPDRPSLAAAAAGAALLLSLTLGLSACGSDDDPVATGDEPAAEGEETSLGAAALEHAQCMREHGIEDYPDPEISDDGRVQISPGDIDPDDPEVQAADEECSSILEDAGPTEGVDDEAQAEIEENALAFAECMREHGIDFPDPEIDGGRVMMRPPEGVEIGSPELVEAEEACQGELGDLGSPTGGQP